MRIIEEKEKPMTDEMKQRVIRVINELREYSMIDQQIEDWKKDDDMDGPLSWALGVRIEVKELLADLEGESND
ncbi:MAG: hypothetical protein CMI27_02050 [Opitutae bacterium]|nr:hypothetical protein [Opitutae bacterium]|tara:strand:+ start:6694 stop:6912 length:219 start_codon:yes stop_codon:yes gene_type:complete